MTRAQTTLDFLVGTTVFLLTVSAVLVTVPGLVDPFATGQESNTITADRAAESLATDVLVASTNDPFVFEPAKVDAFFDAATDAKDRLGIESDITLNVTLTNSTTQLQSIGPPVPPSTDTSVAWRAGRYRNEYAEITVRVW